MRTLVTRLLALAACLVVSACSSTRPLPKYEKPIARTAVQNVRTTAYTDSESDHIRYTNHNALGGSLKCGSVHSAAADWSRWPAGSVFRIVETGEIYEVDDYGWALAGTNTIDLYKPSRRAMNAWGVRRVTIENLRWGAPERSLAILRQRSRYAHVRRMIDGLKTHQSEPAYAAQSPVAQPASAQPASRAVPVASAVTASSDSAVLTAFMEPRAMQVKPSHSSRPSAPGQ